MSVALCSTVQTFTINSPRLSISSSRAHVFVVLFYATNSPAPESTVISRYNQLFQQICCPHQSANLHTGNFSWCCDRLAFIYNTGSCDRHKLTEEQPLCWTETSVKTVSKGLAATCRGAPASLPSNQRKETLRLGDHCIASARVSRISHSVNHCGFT